MVTVCTTRFNVNKFHLISTECIYVFLLISEQTAIIALYSLNWLIFITQTAGVYCAVRTGFLYTIHDTLCPLKDWGHGMQFYLMFSTPSPFVTLLSRRAESGRWSSYRETGVDYRITFSFSDFLFYLRFIDSIYCWSNEKWHVVSS